MIDVAVVPEGKNERCELTCSHADERQTIDLRSQLSQASPLLATIDPKCKRTSGPRLLQIGGISFYYALLCPTVLRLPVNCKNGESLTKQSRSW